MAEISSPEIEAIIATYQPREAALEVPFPSPTTNDLEDPIEKYKSGYVPCSLTPSTRATKVTHIDFAPLLSSAGVRGMVTNVAHGTFHSRPASLIIFQFSLRSGEHGFRFKNANVKITFSKHPSASTTDPSPAILKFAPRKIFGLPTVEGKRNRIGGEISLQVPAGPVTIGPKISGETESKYEKEHRFKMVGNFWSSKHGSDWDIVYWDVRENKRTKHGIPDQLNVAVMVERESAFTASVEVTVDTPVANGVFGFPWSKNCPVAFVPGVVMGEQPKTDRFDVLTDDEWRALIPFDEEWESKFTEAVLRSGQATPVPETSGPGGSGGTGIVNYELLQAEESDDR
jgi:hypothetical protein